MPFQFFRSIEGFGIIAARRTGAVKVPTFVHIDLKLPVGSPGDVKQEVTEK
jgi:hypothetical protein